MKQNNLGDEMAMMEWVNCFEYRKAKMIQYNGLEDIYNDWPCLTRINAFSFVSKLQ